jgi:hypothetical protein
MPRKAAAKEVATVSKRDNLPALIDSQLAAETAGLAGQLGRSSSNRIKVLPKGEFEVAGVNVGNEIQIVVVDFNTRNNFYKTKFSPDNPSPPDCYAISALGSASHPDAIGSMAPEADSPDLQNPACNTCWANQWESGDGKGKACQNRRNLAVLYVDPEAPDAHNDAEAPLHLLDLSPTQGKSYDAVAKMIGKQLNKPPIGAIITVTAENVGTYAALTFNNPVPNPDVAAHLTRRAEAAEILNRKPDFTAAAAKPATPARGRAATPARRGAAPAGRR